MDATTLRIVLLILGLLLLVALYLWERQRAAVDDDDDRRESRPDDVARYHTQRVARRDATDELYLERFREPPAPGHGRADAGGDDRGRDDGLPYDTLTDDTLTDDELSDDALIVQFFLVARGEPFAGEDLRSAAARHHLIPGEMDIYHRRKVEGGQERARFSMANLVAPGTFPFEDLEAFSTPGLALFARLTGAPSDLMVFDDLVQTANALAAELDGELQQRDRSPLTREATRQLRVQVREQVQQRGDTGPAWTGPDRR